MSVSELRTDEEITRIYNKYADTVYRICFMMMKNVPEAEDALHNVFLKYINYAKKPESEEHIKALLIVMAKNECKNMLKFWFRSKRNDLDTVTDIPCPTEEKPEIWDKVMSLGDKYKIPIYLYYYEGYSTAEIAKMLCIKHSTLRTHLSKGREKLKIMLEEDGYEQ